MAELLKNQYGPEIPTALASQLAAVWPDFDTERFLQLALQGYDNLELMARGRHIAAALQPVLPPSYPQAIDILLASLGAPLPDAHSFAMSAFYYLPHTCYVARFGLDDFETSMAAQYELTQRFTAEFSIRGFIERYPQQTLERLHQWAMDDNYHVRRLVSEGTRTRLPWAGRLKQFQQDPAPVLALLEKLKDDPELYVRRSVANNLNDIGKDHPQLLTQVAARWMQHASTERQWIVRHALRSAIKRGDTEALAVLGYATGSVLEVSSRSITPGQVKEGESVMVALELFNPHQEEHSALVDFVVHYIKANGSSSAKVFKLKELKLQPGERRQLQKKVSLAAMTTRKHYPGVHRVDVQINGICQVLGSFELIG